ncbi:hypothetical protein [Escherichia coli]|uniref:hypothetical protein n=1 Tax=Escherichia coli TaxID=562 RepID=UPI00202F2A06|nr:hypothetical protein [Escherichia coli]
MSWLLLKAMLWIACDRAIMLVQLESCMQKVFHSVFIANNKEDLVQVAYKLISLDNEKYYHLRQTIYSKRELFLKRDMRKF